jgi:outer membrane protein assembly factor BamB
VLALCSAAALAGCTEPRATADDTAVSPDRPLRLVDPPRGTEADPLGGLPVTDSSDRLLVSTLDLEGGPTPGKDSLRLLDLGRGTTDDLELPDGRLAAFTPSGDLLVAVGPRTLELRSATTGSRAPIQLPDEVGGSIDTMDLIDDRVVLTVAGDQGPQTVVLTPDGDVHCTGPAGADVTRLGAELLWSVTLDSSFDPATCAVSPPLVLPGTTTQQPLTANGTDLFAAVGAQDELGVFDRGTVARFDLTTGRIVATSDRVGRQVSDAVLHDGDLWVLADGHVVRLQPDTLEIRSSEALSPDAVDCGFPFFVRSAGELFVVDDCSLVLYLIDTASGRSRLGWVFPSDGASDSEISAVVSDHGIWLVDVEQTGVPYLFDPAQRRFERLPLTTAETRDIYAMDLDVHPRPGD